MEPGKKKTGRLIMGAAFVQLAAAVAFMAYGLISHNLTAKQGNLLIAGSLLLYWLLADIAEPIALKRFRGITPEQKAAYLKFAGFDLAGYAGICYFLCSMAGSTGGSGIIGAAVYAFSVKLKRDNQDIFYGLEKQTKGSGEEQEQKTDRTAAEQEKSGTGL